MRRKIHDTAISTTWNANSRPANQEIAIISENPKDYYSKAAPLVPRLIQMNPAQAIPTYLIKIDFKCYATYI
jgi:hypothetical protein